MNSTNIIGVCGICVILTVYILFWILLYLSHKAAKKDHMERQILENKKPEMIDYIKECFSVETKEQLIERLGRIAGNLPIRSLGEVYKKFKEKENNPL